MGSNGKDFCEIHLSSPQTPEYQKLTRYLNKKNYPKNVGTLGEKIADRIPVNKLAQCQEKVYRALSEGFPSGWAFLPHTKEYLWKNMPEEGDPETILSKINDCIEILSPGASKIFAVNSYNPTYLYGPYVSKEISETYKAEIGGMESLLIRAEVWLSITSEIKWGGDRQNAGGPNRDTKF